ncbi:hypothetical protein LSCM1_07176 [Leishmania martiniquensis]|uniref:Uncharacterized protein n=1 Tax=Leishmania martiniquensis TaxID=1580590 RepID=A0A836KSJ4_9TRYP|nr:hypothetical protein LSCM1_07176 [Leishmania martiniquensis]
MATTATTPYTRSAILTWANDILEASYTNFQSIPSHEVGLLLYGVFHDSPCKGSAEASRLGDAAAAAAGNAGVPRLSEAELHVHHKRHQATCMRYLQLLQFPSTPSSTAAATEAAAPKLDCTYASSSSPCLDGHNGATSAVAQQCNAEHVLAMIRALSAEEAELLRAEANDTPASDAGSTSNIVLLLGPSMTPAAWLSGGAFVEELKLWRWVRLMAERHRCSVRAIRRTIRAYLQQEVGTTPAFSVAAKEARTSAVDCAQSRGASPAPRSPVVVREAPEMTEPERGEARVAHIVGQTARAHAEDEPNDRASPEMKRMRPELLPSASRVPVHAAAVAGAAATIEAPAMLSVTPLVGSLSPGHGFSSAITEVAAAPGARADDSSASGRSWVTSSSSALTASEATMTPYVAQVGELQTKLRSAQQALQNALALERAQQPQPLSMLSASTTESASVRSSDGGTPDGVGAMHKAAPLLVPATNPCDAQECLLRQRMVSTVFAKTPGCQGDSSLSSPVPDPRTCDVCPAILGHAIQGNLAAIDSLEEVRARAIAACLKRDAVALLAALQSIV